MSVYNECERFIRESIESILTQSFSDFEFIIVCDNPNRYDEVTYILDSCRDSRIVYIRNENNIGLAMSLNKAASIATTDLFLRMDADDIAETTRIQKEYDILVNGDYDFVFSRYSLIDSDSNEIDGFTQPFLPYNEIIQHPFVTPRFIHHPTVMFKKQIFEKAGGYRPFPCAQDLDLWYRLVELGCRFIMLDESLLKYRINVNSVSSQRWHQQQLTCDYINELLLERLKQGHDSFSVEHYKHYLKHNGLNNKNSETKLSKAYFFLKISKQHRLAGRYYFSLYYKIKAIITSKILFRRTIVRLMINVYTIRFR